LASTPALRAPRAAVRDVVFAALRAFCWRPRAWPPFLAAAVRFADDPRELEDDDLARDELAVERLRDALEDERLLLADERPLLADERLDPPDFLDPPRELPLLRRSAIWYPS
jgi:hypothetical protein